VKTGKIRVVVIDGNELTRALLKYVFHTSSTIEIVGEAAGYESAVTRLEAAVPDAAIIGDDLHGDKPALLTFMRSNLPEVRVIELSDLEKAFLRKVNLDPDGLDQGVFNTIFAGSTSGSIQ